MTRTKRDIEDHAEADRIMIGHAPAHDMSSMPGNERITERIPIAE